MAESFLTHKLGDLPVWGWGLAGIGGVGIAFFVIKSRGASHSAIPTGMQASNVSGGNVLPDYSTVAGQSSPGTPFPTVPGATGNPVPVFPGPGWTPILDGQGNVIGWNPPGTPPGNPGVPVPIQPGPVPPTSGTPQPGTYFKGSTGVGHYVSTGNQTIQQIAAYLHDARQPADPMSLERLNNVPSSYMPPVGTVLTV